MSNINTIRVSGTTYQIEDSNASKTVELTQAQYDALPSSAKTSNTLFVITDAIGVDVTTTITSGSTDSEVPTAKAVYNVVGDIETLLSEI